MIVRGMLCKRGGEICGLAGFHFRQDEVQFSRNLAGIGRGRSEEAGGRNLAVECIACLVG